METTINKLQTNQEKDVVTVHFTVQKEAESVHEKISLPVANEKNYTPYKDLTEEIVLGWITETGEHERAIYILERRLKEKAQILEPPLPWGGEDEES